MSPNNLRNMCRDIKDSCDGWQRSIFLLPAPANYKGKEPSGSRNTFVVNKKSISCDSEFSFVFFNTTYILEQLSDL